MIETTQFSTPEVEDAHTSGAYAKRPLVMVRGEGCTVWDDAGKAYLDVTSGQGIALLGHAHPAVTKAIAEQAQKLVICTELFYNDRRADLYALLDSLMPGDLKRYFLCNSGAEAIEGSLKVAKLLTGRSHIVATKRGFHGRTMGALSLTWNPKYREPFQPWTFGNVSHISYNDLDAAAAAISDQTAAVVVESVQGEGGVYPIDPTFLQGLRRLCDERGALLIVDEIQAGLGRAGRWFGFQYSNILPDIVALGKGIAGGVPMGVVAWRKSLGKIDPSTHSTTFGGNPLACAAAVAALTVLRDDHLPERSAELGTWLLEELRKLNHPQIREVRGLGLFIGIELRGRSTPVLKRMQELGVLALAAGLNVVRLLPPLVITREELCRVVEALGEALTDATE